MRKKFSRSGHQTDLIWLTWIRPQFRASNTKMHSPGPIKRDTNQYGSGGLLDQKKKQKTITWSKPRIWTVHHKVNDIWLTSESANRVVNSKSPWKRHACFMDPFRGSWITILVQNTSSVHSINLCDSLLCARYCSGHWEYSSVLPKNICRNVETFNKWVQYTLPLKKSAMPKNKAQEGN